MKKQLKNLILRFCSTGNHRVFSIDRISTKLDTDQYTSFTVRRKQIDSASHQRSSRTNTNLY